jgi:hypothetical protein
MPLKFWYDVEETGKRKYAGLKIQVGIDLDDDRSVVAHVPLFYEPPGSAVTNAFRMRLRIVCDKRT